MQISPTNPLKPLSGDDVAFGILGISYKTAAESGVTAVALLLFRSLNGRRLRISAEARSRWLIIRCRKQQKQPACHMASDTAGWLGVCMNASSVADSPAEVAATAEALKAGGSGRMKW